MILVLLRIIIAFRMDLDRRFLGSSLIAEKPVTRDCFTAFHDWWSWSIGRLRQVLL